MEKRITTRNLKSKTKSITSSKARMPEADIQDSYEERSSSLRFSLSMRRPESYKSSAESMLMTLEADEMQDPVSPVKEMNFELIRKERCKLEFLFAEGNKINRNAVKYILSKWTLLEGALQEAILEKKLKAVNKSLLNYKTKTFAQVVTENPRMRQYDLPEIKNKASEVILFKPENENNSRNNEEIKAAVLEKCEAIKDKIKVKSVRQMRQKGIIMEVNSKQDTLLVKQMDTKSAGLRIESPRKYNPQLIIYGVERELKKEELMENLINKNFLEDTDMSLMELKEKIKINYGYKAKDDNINWIVQVPAPLFTRIIKRGRVFIAWRSYRIKEFINIVRCFRCHGFGHFAGMCSAEAQLCEKCGKTGHNKKDCTNEEVCINCIKTRRKEYR